MTAHVTKRRSPLAAAARLATAAVCAVVAVWSLAQPAGWLYMTGEVLLGIAVSLAVAPAFREGASDG